MFCMVLKNSFGNSAEVNRHSLYIQKLFQGEERREWVKEKERKDLVS